MIVTATPPVLAPQTTGHPAALPPDPPPPDPATRVGAVAGSDNAGKAQTGPRKDTAPRHSAPPSAMQIQIMEILEEQAREASDSRRGS